MKLISICAFIVFVSCSAKHDPISPVLTKAIVGGKISSNKSSKIIQEYIELQSRDEEAAKSYLYQLEFIVERGGDSTEIDVMRKQFRGKVSG
jgi:hypothetical protein